MNRGVSAAGAASGGPPQLTLELPHAASLGPEHFLAAKTNAAALEFVERWPDGSAPAALIHGPPGTGKSHLVSIWRARTEAAVTPARELTSPAFAPLTGLRAYAVEDVDRGVGEESLLFHLLNLARQGEIHLLLTSRAAPGDIEVALPDLRSRLRALPALGIEEPDPSLLEALLVKLFADRQLDVEPHVISHLALHMERSAAAAPRLVAEVDRLALATRRRATRAVAAEALVAVSTHPNSPPAAGADRSV